MLVVCSISVRADIENNFDNFFNVVNAEEPYFASYCRRKIETPPAREKEIYGFTEIIPISIPCSSL